MNEKGPTEIEIGESGAEEDVEILDRSNAVGSSNASPSPKYTYVDTEAKAAYRHEMAVKRTKILTVLIIPVALVLIVWNFFDNDSRWEVNPNKSRNTLRTVEEYMNQLNQNYATGSFGENNGG